MVPFISANKNIVFSPSDAVRDEPLRPRRALLACLPAPLLVPVVPVLAGLQPAAARAAASHPGPVAIGQRVDWPGVTLLDGRRLVAADLRDRAVVLVLFSIDCPYCHRHNRRIDRLAREVRARSLPLTVLAAAYDRDATAVAAHVAREELALPVTLEAQALRQWLNARRVMPMTCVIDRESVLRELIPGEMADADVQGLLRWARG